MNLENMNLEYITVTSFQTFWIYTLCFIHYNIENKIYTRNFINLAYFPYIDLKRLYYCETDHKHGRPRKDHKIIGMKGYFQLHIRGFCSRLSRWLGIRLENGFKNTEIKIGKVNDKGELQIIRLIFDRSGLDVSKTEYLDLLIKQKLKEYKERGINPLSIQLYHSLPKF